MAYFIFENKKVFYKIIGRGEPLLLLHGNTASSGMFAEATEQYASKFKVILIDFPGHGKSERLDTFNADFWYYNSLVCNALLEELNLSKVTVIGTSGGALVGINLALEHSEKVKFLIADSFEGEFPLPEYIDSIEAERAESKKNEFAQQFWSYCHGEDWERIVDLDTHVNLEFAKTGKSFFHKPISELRVPTLLTGSMQDEFCNHLDKIYSKMKEKNPKLEIYLFKEGNHPAMLSNNEEFLRLFQDHIN